MNESPLVACIHHPTKPDLELTATCWAAVKSRAVQKVNLQNVDTGRLDGQLSKLKRQQNGQSVEDAIAALAAEPLAALIETLSNVESEFKGFKPQCDRDGTKVMNNVAKVLAKQAADHRGAAELRLEELSAAAAA